MTSVSVPRRRETAGVDSRSRPASIHDVARLAGVSNQTISRVLNGHPSVRGATRDRVLAAIGELRYRPNRAARILGTRRSQLIGVLTAEAGSRRGQAGAVRAVEEAARERGYYASVVHLASDSPPAISAAAEDLLGQEVEGVVIVAPQLTVLAGIAPLLAPVPIVTSLGELRNAGGSLVPSGDAGRGARMAVRYLIEQGHRRIVHVAGPRNWHDAQSRLAGYESELRSSGLPALPPVFADGSADSGYAAGRALLEYRARAAGPDPGFTAVFAASDQLALGLMHAFRQARLEVPADVSVAGFGDIPEAAHFWPPLTTIREDVRELGRARVAALIDAIGRLHDPNAPGPVTSPPPAAPAAPATSPSAAATSPPLAVPAAPPPLAAPGISPPPAAPRLVIRESVAPVSNRLR